MTHNQIDYAKHLEDVKHNRTVENETNRQNVASLNETIRNNTNVITETSRHNVGVETETNRHNVVTEDVSQQQNVINREHYVRQDSVANKNANETIRHNKVGESLEVFKYNTDKIYKEALGAAAIQNSGANALNSINSLQKNANDYAVNQEKLKQGQATVNSQTALNRAKEIQTYVSTAKSTLDIANNIAGSAKRLIAKKAIAK